MSKEEIEKKFEILEITGQFVNLIAHVDDNVISKIDRGFYAYYNHLCDKFILCFQGFSMEARIENIKEIDVLKSIITVVY